MFSLGHVFNEYEARSVSVKIKHILKKQKAVFPPAIRQPPFSPEDAWSSSIQSMTLMKTDAQGIVFSHQVNHSLQGFRLDPSLERTEKKEHLYLVGCSLTFGNGVDNDETFSALLAKKLPSFEVVNMGKRGGWIGEQWYLWHHYDFQKINPYPKGWMIVTFLDDHFFRMSQTWSALSWLSPLDLDLHLTEHGPQVSGLLGSKLSLNFAYFLNKIPFVEYLWLKLTHHLLPFQLDGAESEMAEYLFYLKKAYLSQYPKGRFVVSKMLGYSWTRWPLNKEKFFQQLAKRKIEIWDNSDIDVSVKTKYASKLYIPRDSHSTALTHQLQSEFLFDKINDR
jgi:hypothetical protein